MTHEFMEKNMNFYDDIDKYKDRIAIITDDERTILYRDLIKTADKISENVNERSIIFLICENSFASIAAYIGFLRKRAVPVLINPKNDISMFKALYDTYRPRYVFCKTDRDCAGIEIMCVDDFHLLKTENENDYSINPELAVMLTTSGSTGSSKLVMQTYSNITSNAASIVQYLKIDKDDRAITTMPMNYTYGLSIIQSHLLSGACIIVTEKTFMDKSFWTLLKEKKATTFGGVPYVYEILKKLRFANMNVPDLKYITQAGGRLSKEMVLEYAEICRDKGMKFIVMYGQTEATARMSYLPWENIFDKAGSVGIAIPDGEFMLIGIDEKQIKKPGQVGELVYSGPNVTLGYAEKITDLSNTDGFNGVLHTGDMAKFDDEGFYYIVGRKKRFLKVFGNRVNLDEMDSLLESAGYECACSGTDDHVKIYIVSDNENDCQAAIDFISTKTKLNKVAFSASLIKEIPRNSSGKISYSKLEELHG